MVEYGFFFELSIQVDDFLLLFSVYCIVNIQQVGDDEVCNLLFRVNKCCGKFIGKYIKFFIQKVVIGCSVINKFIGDIIDKVYSVIDIYVFVYIVVYNKFIVICVNIFCYCQVGFYFVGSVGGGICFQLIFQICSDIYLQGGGEKWSFY